jgi:ORF6N domain-containing protein
MRIGSWDLNRRPADNQNCFNSTRMSSIVVLKPENIAQLVLFIRGEKVILDRDLASLYGVRTKALNQAVKRNALRFPPDFMFQLTKSEYEASRSQPVTAPVRSKSATQAGAASSRSQSVTLKRGQNIKYFPYAFTEQGVAMLSSVLRSSRAVEVNIAIMRTFVQLRRLMENNRDLARKIDGLEKKYDEQFAVVFAAIKELITPPAPVKKQIGFHP